MCGIIGYVGSEPVLPILMEGLRRLEYRGYDSAGVAVVDGEVRVERKAGKLDELDKVLAPSELPGSCGIGHTRWATHGGPTDRNAHPHRDCTGRIALIHNGIIENFFELRERLESEGHTFASDTDTEVIAHLVEGALEGGDLAAAVRVALRELDGAFSLAVVSADSPGHIVAAKRTSPMIVGRGEHGTFLASDPPALLPYMRDMVHILDDQLVEIRSDGFTISTIDGEEAEGTPIHVDWDVEAAEKAGYDHFMLKEIDEQPRAVADALRGRIHDGELMLDELRLAPSEIRDIDKVFVVACGTSFHAGLVAKYAIEHWTRLPVEIEVASEFRYRDPVLDRDTLVVAVSQSGETIDTLEAVKHAKAQKAKVVAVTNVVGSSIAREADAVIYQYAGPEISVASTKAFTTQMVALKILALYLAQTRATMYPSEVANIVGQMGELPALLERTLEQRDEVRAAAEHVAKSHDVLFMGRHVGYPVALEGALKLKEISYLHAEGYAAGELKHGPIALIEEGVPVVAVATKSHVYPKMLSNIQEVKARGAYVIAVANEGDTEVARHADRVLTVPVTHDLLQPELVAVPLQLLAYYVAVLRGHDVDQPRNLAKSVTVE